MEDFINEKTIVENTIYDAFQYDIFCPICSKILIEPKMCMKCQNVYCEQCIKEWSKRNNQCPNRCDNPNYRKSIERANILSKLKFKCQKCGTQFSYDEMKKHANICKQDKNIEENNDNSKKKIKRLKKEEIEKARNGKDILHITCKKNKYKFKYSNHIRCFYCWKIELNRNVRYIIFKIIIFKIGL